ncbi:MAG: YqgE/AlgH family protein [Acidimicrobiales bacterium]
MPGGIPDGQDAGPRGLIGRLLVASPELGDPNFERAVILLLDHGTDGALGIVLNRPTGLPVEEILEPWYDQACLAPPGVVFSGGPVSREAVIGLARSLSAKGDLAHVDGVGRWRPVVDRLGTVDLSVPPEDQPFPLAGARLFSGYAGWTTGQLEEEVGEGAWYLVDATGDDLLCAEPDRLWHDVLRRQRGKLAMLAAYPPHPSVN